MQAGRRVRSAYYSLLYSDNVPILPQVVAKSATPKKEELFFIPRECDFLGFFNSVAAATEIPISYVD